MGRFIDKTGLFLEAHCRVQAAVERRELLESTSLNVMSQDELGMLTASKQFLNATDKSHLRYAKNIERRTDDIRRFCEARILKPQRLVSLTLEQERFRCEQTWKLLDKRIHLAAFGSIEQLVEHVGQPERFAESRKQCVLLQSDQVPFYVKIRPSKQLHAAHDYRRDSSKSVLSPADKQIHFSDGHGKQGVGLTDELPIEDLKKPMAQTRGAEHGNQDKYRITIELMHEIHHWFDPSKRPIGCLARSLLGLPGKHADLSNIDDNHRWKETRRFWVAGKPEIHEKGKYTSCLNGLVKLRNTSERVRNMLSVFYIMSQPAGFVDQVIMSWHLSH